MKKLKRFFNWFKPQLSDEEKLQAFNKRIQRRVELKKMSGAIADTQKIQEELEDLDEEAEDFRFKLP